jgi:hypothetical protein
MATLTPQVFQTLLAVGWIDGDLAREEAHAILELATDAGLSDDALEELGRLASSRVQFTDLDVAGLSRDQRLFVYATSSWVARADRVVTDDEQAALHAVATVLGLTATGRRWVDELVDAWHGSEQRPGRFDLSTLRTRLDEALASRAEA